MPSATSAPVPQSTRTVGIVLEELPKLTTNVTLTLRPVNTIGHVLTSARIHAAAILIADQTGRSNRSSADEKGLRKQFEAGHGRAQAIDFFDVPFCKPIGQ